jgi:hypothetical protein
VAEIKKNERPDLKMVNFGQTRRSALLNLRLSGRGNELHGLANTVCFSYQREENTTHNERQFRQFLDAADHLGSHMRETFDLPFLKIVLSSGRSNSGMAVRNPLNAVTQRPSGNITSIEDAKSWNRQDMIPPTPDDVPTQKAGAIDASIVVRLYFAP